jgi:(p)ppGpp synthase/HD superfamily hydrolase|tara:strand:- start:985 stop:1377 length:393 start_codon:yes stop_codon:yes gene_type:complete
MNKKERMAFALAQQAHKGQLRKGKNKDYITHPIKVYKILKGLTDKEDVLCAALLHDVIEDTKYTYNDLKKKFGKRVADIVMEVTKDKKGNFNIKTKEGLVVKLADMLHNIHNNREKTYLRKKIKFVERLE